MLSCLKIKFSKFLCLCLFIIYTPFLSAEILSSPSWGYSVDLPEGFVLTSTNGNDSFLFEHGYIPVYFILLSYTNERYPTPSIAMKNVMNKLESEYET